MARGRRNRVVEWKDEPVILTVERVGLILNRTPEAVRRYCQDKTIPAEKVGTEWCISKENLRRRLGEEPEYTSPEVVQLLEQILARITPGERTTE